MNERSFIVGILALFIFSSSISLGYSALFIYPVQTETNPPCPTYQTNLAVILVNSVPHVPTNLAVGAVVVTTVHVVYPDGTPVSLAPQTISFLWTGPDGQKTYNDVPVTPTGSPGFYNYTATITNDLLSAIGQGALTIAAVACSCSDGLGNRGPTGFENSETTLEPTDDSHVQVGTGIVPLGPFGSSSLIFIAWIIIALLIIALLAFIALYVRCRKKNNREDLD